MRSLSYALSLGPRSDRQWLHCHQPTRAAHPQSVHGGLRATANSPVAPVLAWITAVTSGTKAERQAPASVRHSSRPCRRTGRLGGRSADAGQADRARAPTRAEYRRGSCGGTLRPKAAPRRRRGQTRMTGTAASGRLCCASESIDALTKHIVYIYFRGRGYSKQEVGRDCTLAESRGFALLGMMMGVASAQAVTVFPASQCHGCNAEQMRAKAVNAQGLGWPSSTTRIPASSANYNRYLDAASAAATTTGPVETDATGGEALDALAASWRKEAEKCRSIHQCSRSSQP